MPQYVSIDCETELIKQGCLAPKLVCVSQSIRDYTSLHRWNEAKEGVFQAFTKAARGEIILIGHNFAFDVAVFMVQWPDITPLVFAAYDVDGVEDTMIREKLLDLATAQLGMHTDEDGTTTKVKYSLNDLAQRYFGQQLDKGADGWRLRYGELRNVPLHDWPERAVTYAKDDATTTFRVAMAQEERRKRYNSTIFETDCLADSPAQARAALALHLMSCRGMMTDPVTIEKLQQDLEDQKATHRKVLEDSGLLNSKGGVSVKTLREYLEQNHPMAVERTEKGNIKTSIEALVLIDDPLTQAYCKYKKVEKALSSYVTKLHHGVTHPIQPWVNTLLETGRTSMGQTWSGVNGKGFSLQTLPRSGGIRECFIPRPGYVFVDCDYSVAELRSLAQVMLHLFESKTGTIPMAELFQKNAKADPHSELAKVINATRQDAKNVNFSFPGGAGAQRFVSMMRTAYLKSDGKAGGIYTLDQAQRYRDLYCEKWQMQPYFNWVAKRTAMGSGIACQLYSGRYRNGCTFTQLANTMFQGLTSDGMKAALYDLAKAMYMPGGSLPGCYVINCIHDEVLVEAPKGFGQAVGEEVARIMVEAMERYTPDIPAIAEPEVMDRWHK